MIRLTPARIAVASFAAALAGAGLLTTPVSAATPQGSTTVTVFLKAPHGAALNRLAATPGLSHQARLARLARLVPSASAHQAVVQRLRAEGFSVGSQTAWTVTATGPASTVTDLFGTRPKVGANPSAADLAQATGTLPDVPAGLDSLVSGVFPTTAGPRAYVHHATTALVGSDIRKADTPAGVTPSSGTHDAGTTVATLQLADFASSDLTHYATSHSIPDPVASHQYLPVTVDGGPSITDDEQNGDVEVDLDQESILSAAPTADQHAYFAPNTNAGFGDVFASVFDDVTGDAQATQPDPHITALSSSWGSCETRQTAATINALEPVITSLVAAGVTVFAASGDDGIYDCRTNDGTGTDNSQADVDYPASSPHVVATGGSRLSSTTSTSKANNGHNWTETAWSCTSPVSCQSTSTGTGGGGGGESGSAYQKSSSGGTGDFKGFAAPIWQRRTIKDTPFAGATKRLVPDITAAGDPASGFVIYTSDSLYVAECGGNTCQFGGTSLASPLSAAQLDNALADAGHTTGVGDIHAALYSAYARTGGLATTSSKKVFRDVVSGTNGASADRGTDPSVKARSGYDTTSGVGGVLWSALTPYLFDRAAPSPRGKFAVVSYRHPKQKAEVRLRWHIAQGRDTDAFGPATVILNKVGSSRELFTSSRSAGTHTFNGTKGATYRARIVGTDIAGHRSATKVVRFKVHKHG